MNDHYWLACQFGPIVFKLKLKITINCIISIIIITLDGFGENEVMKNKSRN